MQRAKRARAVLAWSPVWDDVPKKWAIKFIRHNQWRCDRIYGFDDLLQEAYLVFLKITEKYPRVNNPQNFMGLYKMALANWFHDRAAYMKRKNTIHADLSVDPTELLTSVCEWHTDGIRLLLDEAPHELKLALALIVDHPEAIRSLPDRKKPRENLNMKLRRILGLSETFDLKASLTELLFN